MPDTLNRLFSTIKKTITANLPFVILIAILSGYLTVRALPENNWNGWHCCSTQALLTARFWARDGFLNHYFLQISQGYGKIVRYFDDPELQHHAHSNPAIGGLLKVQKLYYTHYPSFYIVPIALLMKLGINSLFIFKLLAIIASLAGLVFFYAFAKLISNKIIALIAVFYFAVSPIFISFADILEYLPLEDALRFLIMFLSILFLRRLKLKSLGYYKTFLGVIWVSYFLLSLTSYNSTVFIFTWLAGLTAIYLWRANIVYKKTVFVSLLALWVSAPVLGFAIHLIQNVVYLGWHNMWLDIYGTFTSVGNSAGLDLLTRIEGIIRPFFSATGIYNFYTLAAPFGLSKIKQVIMPLSIPLVYILPFLMVFVIMIIVKIRKFKSSNWPFLGIILLLLAAPLSQTFFLPLTGYRDQMGRLAAPFIGIIIGSVTYYTFSFWRKWGGLILAKKIFLFIISIVLMSLFAIQITLSFVQAVSPSSSPLSDSDIAFTQYVKNITAGEKAVFMINTFDTQIPEEELKKRWAQYNPIHYQGNYKIWEYYFDMPLLNFTKTSYLIRDLLFLEKRAEFPFTAIVTSDDNILISELYEKLQFKRLPLSPIKILENRYYFLIKK